MLVKLVINQCVFLSSLTPRLWNMQNMSRCVSWVLKSFKYNGSFAILGSQNLQQQFHIGILPLDRSLWFLGSMRFPRLWHTDYALVTRGRLWKNFRPWLISQLHLQHWILGPVMFHMTGSSKCFPMQLPMRFDFCWWFSHLLFVSHVARQRRMMTVLLLDFIGRKLWMLMWTLHLTPKSPLCHLSTLIGSQKKGTYCQYIWAKEAEIVPKEALFLIGTLLYLHLNESDS